MEVAWVQGQSARGRMVERWSALREPSDEATWWIRKAAADHMAEHLDRLRDWTAELIARRPTTDARSDCRLDPPDRVTRSLGRRERERRSPGRSALATR